MLLRNAGDENHTEPDAEDHHGASEVRLQENEYKKEKCVDARYKNVSHVLNLNVPAGKIFGKDENDHQLCHIGWLEREYAEAKPALHSPRDFTDDKETPEQC